MSNKKPENKTPNQAEPEDYKSFLIILVCGIVLGVVVYYGLAFLSGESRYSNKASFLMRTIPVFEAPKAFFTTQDSFSHAMLKDEPVHIVNYFASWCAPCVIEHPNLIKIAEETNTPIHGVVIKDSKVNIQMYLEDHGNPYATLSENNSDLSKIFNIMGLPETYVLNHEGKVLLHFQGPIMQYDLDKTFMPLIKRLQQDFKQ